MRCRPLPPLALLAGDAPGAHDTIAELDALPVHRFTDSDRAGILVTRALVAAATGRRVPELPDHDQVALLDELPRAGLRCWLARRRGDEVEASHAVRALEEERERCPAGVRAVGERLLSLLP